MKCLTLDEQTRLERGKPCETFGPFGLSLHLSLPLSVNLGSSGPTKGRAPGGEEGTEPRPGKQITARSGATPGFLVCYPVVLAKKTNLLRVDEAFRRVSISVLVQWPDYTGLK